MNYIQEHAKLPESLSSIFIGPESKMPLTLDLKNKRMYNSKELYVAQDDVFVFLPKTNPEYEGAYLNKIKYVPFSERFPFTLPLWTMGHGYVWEVRKQFKRGSILCELGCASGVKYFGSRYEMIGVDYSFSSLKEIENYRFKLQADAIRLPFRDESLDGIISSFFWEHISPADKEKMLKEFHRVLKPGGKVVMLYDVETRNSLINRLKLKNPQAYNALFLDKDYHVGYETLAENKRKFKQCGYNVIKHFGMERTIWVSTSAYAKLATQPATYGRFSRLMLKLSTGRLKSYAYMFFVRLLDQTASRLFDSDKSRIAISVIQK